MRQVCLIMMSVIIASCQGGQKKSEEAALKASSAVGEAVGKTSSEFVKGVKEGIDLTFGCKLTVMQSLSAKGIRSGKFMIGTGNKADIKNKLSVYLIFDSSQKLVITATVFDAQGKEYGRIAEEVQAKKGETGFVDFVFNDRTDIESRSTITLE